MRKPLACLLVVSSLVLTTVVSADLETTASFEAQLSAAKEKFVNNDYAGAYETLLPLATRGNPDAQYGVGYMLYYGKGVTADQDAGISWIKASAEQGFAKSLAALEALNIALAADTPSSSSQGEQIASQDTSSTSESVASASANSTSQNEVVASSSYGPTTATDTLWSIAKKVRPENTVSIQQVMRALLAKNPDAFHSDNINGLKANHMLSVPSMAEIKAYDSDETLSMLIKQDINWNNQQSLM